MSIFTTMSRPTSLLPELYYYCYTIYLGHNETILWFHDLFQVGKQFKGNERHDAFRFQSLYSLLLGGGEDDERSFVFDNSLI